MAFSVLEHRDRLGVTAGQIFIDGVWRDGGAGETWMHVHPATNEDVATIACATAADVSDAVGAARRAFDESGWATWQARDRKRLVQRIAELIWDNEDELNNLQTLDNGIPIGFSSIYQVGAKVAGDCFDYHAGWIDRISGETLPTYTGGDFFTYTLKEPVGVVAAIIPWNAPLMLFAQKLAPALASGCTVVLKPSEYASLTSVRLMALLEEAGVPAGVVNLVTGPPDPTGEALITDRRIDKITFTGSRAVGTRMLEASAPGIVRTSLELGGKSPSIVFSDVDIAGVAMASMGMVSMGLSGQGCVCHTRVLAHADIYDDLINGCAEFAAITAYGDPFDPGTTSAALINQRQLERVTGYIDRGIAEGAELVCGGDRPGGDLAVGNFVNPTLFANVNNSMSIATDEIFGPVLSVIPFHDEDDAIRIANDTDYGLGGGVHTNDIKRAIRVSRAIRAGTIGINGFTVMPNAPFGGYKTSGLGREGGSESIEGFLETKTVTLLVGDQGF
jgi:aldehyde dehydrogenase (NAD+)